MGINRLLAYQWPSSDPQRPGGSPLPGLSATTPVHGLLAQGAAPRRRKCFRSILVPLDGTAQGERALPLAVSIAAQAGAELRLLHLHAPLPGDSHSTYSWVDRDRYRQQGSYLRRVSRQVAEAAGITVVPECIRQREIAEGICEAAAHGVDLVVAATHGYGWLGRAVYGSTTHKLMDQLTPPLLIQRGQGLRASIAPDRWLRRVLVPLDGSEQAEEVLNPAAALGSLYEADYSLLTVVPSDGRGIRAGNPMDAWYQQVAAQDYLDETADRLGQRSRRPSAHIALTDDSVARAIVSHAKESRADCIAMASASRRGLQRWFQPSVAHRVIQLSPVPVLVLRNGGHLRRATLRASRRDTDPG